MTSAWVFGLASMPIAPGILFQPQPTSRIFLDWVGALISRSEGETAGAASSPGIRWRILIREPPRTMKNPSRRRVHQTALAILRTAFRRASPARLSSKPRAEGLQIDRAPARAH